MQFFIYQLLHENGVPFYVGVTDNVKRRMKEHRTTLGKPFVYEVIDQGVGEEDRMKCEKYWIAKYREMGFDMANKASGGSRGFGHSDDTRMLLSKIIKGRIVSPTTRLKISRASKGRSRNWTEQGRERGGVVTVQARPYCHTRTPRNYKDEGEGSLGQDRPS